MLNCIEYTLLSVVAIKAGDYQGFQKKLSFMGGSPLRAPEPSLRVALWFAPSQFRYVI